MLTLSANSLVAAHIAIPPKLAVSLVILVLSLIVWGIVALATSGKKSNLAVPRPDAPFCSTCGIRANWIAAQSSWSCIRCMRAVAPPMQAPPMQAQPPMQAAPQAPFCPTCGTAGRWIPESNGWGCDRCQAMINPPAARTS